MWEGVALLLRGGPQRTKDACLRCWEPNIEGEGAVAAEEARLGRKDASFTG